MSAKPLVQEAGTAWVNGPYEEYGGTRNGKPQYRKIDESVANKNGTFLYWRGPIKCWVIERSTQSSTESIYKNAQNSATPPATGWETYKDGIAPFPTITF